MPPIEPIARREVEDPAPGSRTVVYTDGSCIGNPGPGGWGWVIPSGPYRSGFEARSTNQRMEIAAVLEAVRSIPGLIEVRSDSSYVVNCFKQRWWETWLRKDWRNTRNKPVANRDLWEPLVNLHISEPVVFVKVKGHSGDLWNDTVDRLALGAARARKGSAGDDSSYLVA